MLRMIITHPGVTRTRSESRASWPSSLSPKRSSFYFVIFTQLYSYLFSSLLRLGKPLKGGSLQRLPPVLDLLQLLLELLGGEARGLGAGGDGGLLSGLGVLQDDLNVTRK